MDTNTLKELLERIGLPMWGVLIIIILTPILFFFIKRLIEKRDTRRNILSKYAEIQESALLEAFQMVYENVNIRNMTSNEVRKILSEADALLMRPLTDYRAYLDEEIVNEIYDMHNIFAQFEHFADYQYELTEKDINALADYKEQFFEKIQNFKKKLK